MHWSPNNGDCGGFSFVFIVVVYCWLLIRDEYEFCSSTTRLLPRPSTLSLSLGPEHGRDYQSSKCISHC
uniref:Uncharacterized protein n=1 Tax=Physcomitrium patens TaxID=3218 RepID=A0A2K1INK1_PHYPA|nr:hypothetical protein PHYPA_027154 [Physcomitrium patens]